MKNRILYSVLIIFLLTGNLIYAHGDETYKEREQDSTTLVHDNIEESLSKSSQDNHEMDNHLMIEESIIIDAAMSDFSNLHPLVVHFPIVIIDN